MRRYLSTLALCIGLLFGGSHLHAHQGHDHADDQSAAGMRLWKSASGGSRFRADLVLATDNEVLLRDPKGKSFTLPRWFLCADDDAWLRQRTAEVRRRNVQFVVFQEPDVKKPTPTIQEGFAPFKDKLKVRSEENYFYVESDGLPSHPMMKGIRSWQQQVPLPQPYTGNNAWRIPLKPVLAEKPISAKKALYRGAVALAVNGVPIFNALNNRGEDAFLAGELDEWGGHSGRGDDYHYHIAPLHLEKIVGAGNPIAYALDGFPIFGLAEADGSPVGKLDEFNGKVGNDGTYRYHATKTYPYINGGMRGVVEVRGDQIEPQPRDSPVRPALKPLKGATIVDFTRDDERKTFRLKYHLRGKTHSVTYTINRDDTVTFVFEDDAGVKTTETYRHDRKGPKKGPKDGPEKRKKGRDDEEPPDSPAMTSWTPLRIGLLSFGGILFVVAAPCLVFAGRRKVWLGVMLLGVVMASGGALLTPRPPWVAAHFVELDTNGDGVLTLDELRSEVEKTFSAFDRNGDGKLTKDEYEVDRPDIKTPLAGFVRVHAAEIDANQDGDITLEELLAVVIEMFEKADRKGTGKIVREEADGRK